MNLLLNCLDYLLFALFVNFFLDFDFVSHSLIPGSILAFEHFSLLVFHFLLFVPINQCCFLPLGFQFNRILLLEIKYFILFRVSKHSIFLKFLLNKFLNDSIMRELLLEFKKFSFLFVRVFMLCQIIKNFRIFSGLSLFYFRVFKFFLYALLKRVILFFSSFHFFIMGLFLFLFFFFSNFSHVISYQLISIWSIYSCLKSFILFQTEIKFIDWIRVSYLLGNFWLMILSDMIHKLNLWLEKLY